MNKKKINPIYWVPTVYFAMGFAMGLPFVALSMVSVLLFTDISLRSPNLPNNIA